MFIRNFLVLKFSNNDLLISILVFIFCATGGSPFYYSQNTQKPKVIKNTKPKTLSGKKKINLKQNKTSSQTRRFAISSLLNLDEDQESDKPGKHENPNARLNWFLLQRTYPYQELPAKKRSNAFSFLQRRLSFQKPDPNQPRPFWVQRGPMPIQSDSLTMGATSGRVNTIAISPANPNIILIGSATGGIWRSTDGGVSFSPVSDNQSDLAIGVIAFSPSDPQIVYAGMGDATGGYMGTGVLKSTDGGRFWKKVSDQTLPAPGTVSDLIVDPADPNKVYLAQYSFRDLNTADIYGSGFFISSNGGISWRKTKEGLPTDLTFHPTNPKILYMAMKTTYSDVQPSAGVYRSIDNGESWDAIYTPPDYLYASNIKIAVTPVQPNLIYVYTGGKNKSNTFEAELMVSRDGGSSWNKLNTNTLDKGQFGYNCYIEADPVQSEVIYLGSRDLFKSTDGGITWSDLTNNWSYKNGRWDFSAQNATSHSDQHAIAISRADPNVVLIGNDGGISRTADGGKSFSSLNSTLTLGQLNSISLHPNDSAISCAATQDNGILLRVNNSNQWKEFITGDGGNCFIGISGNEEYYYTSYIFGNLLRFRGKQQLIWEKDIGSNYQFEEDEDEPRIGFYPAFTFNSANGYLYFGSWKLFVSSDNGNSWSKPAKDKDLTKGINDVLATVAVSSGSTKMVYTGSAQGRAMVSKDNGKTWKDVAKGLPNRFIKAIVIDPVNPQTVYLTVSGFGSGHVFKTKNGGLKWVDISGNLGNIPVNALLIDPSDKNKIYIGTDLGVYRSSINGRVWDYFSDGMPPIIVTGFSVNSQSVIQVSTYGRGVFELVKE